MVAKKIRVAAGLPMKFTDDSYADERELDDSLHSSHIEAIRYKNFFRKFALIVQR